MGRYSMRLRNIWGDDEPTFGEQLQGGIHTAIRSINDRRDEDRDFGNEVSKAGGTMATRKPVGIADRLRDWKGTLSGKYANDGGEFDKASTPPMASTERAPTPGSAASRSNTYDGPTGDFVGEDYNVGAPRGALPNSILPRPTGFNPRAAALPQMQEPPRGIAGAITASQQPQQPQQPSPDDSYEVRGPHGQLARIPRTDAETRAKRTYDEGREASLARDIAAARGGDMEALARVQARDPKLLTDVEPFSARSGSNLTPEQRLEEIDRRVAGQLEGRRITADASRYGVDTRSGDSRYGVDTRSGDSRYGTDTRAGSSQYSTDHRTGGAGGAGQTKAQKISALRAQLSIADRLSPPDAQQRRRMERTPDGARRVKQGDAMREEVNGRLEAAINDEEYIKQTPQLGVGQNRATAVARAKHLGEVFRAKYPNATPQQVRDGVERGMKAEGYTGNEPR